MRGGAAKLAAAWVLRCLLLLAAGCAPAAAHTGPERGHTRPRALAVDARGDLLYVALSTADKLAVVDVADGRARVVAELPLCAFPDALAPLPGGGVVAACRFDPGLRVVTRGPQAPTDAGSFRVRVVDAGPEHGHQGLAVDRGGHFAYVASPARGGVKIVGLDESAGAARFVATGVVPRALRMVSSKGEGTLLLVSNFIGHTVTVHRVQPDGGLSMALQTITTEAPVLDMAVTASAALLLLTQEDRVLSRAHLAVEGLDSVVLRFPRAGPADAQLFADPGRGKRLTINLSEGNLSEGGAPSEGAPDPERAAHPLVGLDAIAIAGTGDRVAIVGAGSDNVLVSAPAARSLLNTPATPVGTHPSAVAFLADGRVVTADRLSDTLSFIRAGEVVQTLSVGSPERRSAADRGEVLFYSRALVPHNVATGPLSLYTCAACHADGQIDGRRHPSKRNRFYSMTKTCRGLRGTEPFLSVGKPSTFAAFADNIVATHAQGALDAPQTFDRYPVTLRLRAGDAWKDATLDADQVRVALAAYMSRIPTEPSPFVAPGQQSLTAGQRRGLKLFRDDCAGCHQLFRSTQASRAISGSDIERSLLAGQAVLTSGRQYDVGTPNLGDGGNNPPSLRNVWAAAPYFSDGSAPTLESVVARTNPNAAKIHAPENSKQPAAFSPEARDDLLDFLRAL